MVNQTMVDDLSASGRRPLNMNTTVNNDNLVLCQTCALHRWSSLFIARLQPPRPSRGSQPKVTTEGERQPRHDTTRQSPREFEIASAHQGSSYGPWRFIGSTGRKIRNVRFPHRDRWQQQRTKRYKETKENTPGTFGPRIQEIVRSFTNGSGRIATPFGAGGQSPRLEHLQRIPVVPQVLISYIGRALVDICKRVRSGRTAKLRQTLQARNLCKIRYTSEQMRLIIHPRREPERATNKYLKTEVNETERNDDGD